MTTDDRRFEAIGLAEQFWVQLWDQGRDLEQVRSWVTPDVALFAGGTEICGVGPLVEWMRELRHGLAAAPPSSAETFASVDAARVCTRWRYGAEGGQVHEAIGVWSVQWDRRMPRLARGWLALTSEDPRGLGLSVAASSASRSA